MSKTKAITLTAQARAIVKQAIANIKSKPDQFDMEHWIGKNKSPKALRTCGTSACLAGHIVLAAGLRTKQGDYIAVRDVERKLGFTPGVVHTDEATGKQYTYVNTIANGLLGIDSAQADALYISYEWPDEFREKYDALTYVDGDEDKSRPATALLLKRRANLAVRRLRYFLKEGK